MWKHSALKHGSHCPPAPISHPRSPSQMCRSILPILRGAIAFRYFFLLPLFAIRLFFFFPGEGEGKWMITPLKSGERKKELICQSQGYTFFNTLMGFLMRGGCMGRLHNRLIQQGPSVHIYMSASLGDRANCFSSLLLLLISNFYWHASISQVPSVPVSCCHDSPHYSFPFDFFFLSTGQWEKKGGGGDSIKQPAGVNVKAGFKFDAERAHLNIWPQELGCIWSGDDR